MFVLALPLTLEGRSERVIWQKAQCFDLHLSKAGTYESAQIHTPGMITSVTANWDFQGEVSLEVSVDGGKHYLAVINGVPATTGFEPGNTLCYRATIKEHSILKSVTLFYTDTTGLTHSLGTPQLNGFLYRRAIHLSGSSRQLFNYPVKIDLPDISGPVCFTAADQRTPLAYYRQASESPAENIFWVKVPQIPPEGVDIHVYYSGSPDAADLSSGSDVFMFFDNFAAGALDAEKWEFIPELRGAMKVKDGRLFIRDSAVAAKPLFPAAGISVEFQARTEDASSDLQAVWGDQGFYSSGFGGVELAIAENDAVKVNHPQPLQPAVDYLYAINYAGPEVVFSRQEVSETEEGAAEPAEVKITSEPQTSEVGLQLKSTTAYDLSPQQQGASFDWVRVRSLADPEPRLIALGPQRLANQIQVTPDGYISQNVPVKFPVRVMVASDYPAEGVLSISANGRRNYLRGAEPDRYYYAAKQDFVKGNNLRWKMNTRQLSREGKSLERISLAYFPGNITVISPNGGEIWPAGSRQKISWSAQEYEPGYLLRLEYSQDGGRTYHIIVDSLPNRGSYWWQLPDNLEGEIRIKISDFLAPEVFDVSDASVKIEAVK